MWKKVAIVFLSLLFIAMPVSQVYAWDLSVPTEFVIVEDVSATITEFVITPASVTQYQTVGFTVAVKNTGNVLLDPSGVINVSDSGDNMVKSLTLVSPSKDLAVKGTMEFTTGWNVGSTTPGTYTANATIYYDGKSTYQTSEFSITSPPAPPPPGVPGAGVVIPPIVPPTEALIRFTRLPILREVRPGEAVVTDIFVTNPTRTDFGEAEVSISGIAKDWLSLTPTTISLAPRESKILNLAINPPADALPGDYKVGITISNENIHAENFFILRTKPYPPGYAKPSVTKVVEIDKQRSISTVTIEIKNGGSYVDVLEVVEEIPKEIAQHVNLLRFDTLPSEVLEADPVVKWIIEGLGPYETRSISYSSPKILDEYSPYVYWPLRQINVIYEAPPPDLIKISEISAPTLYPGRTEKVSINLMNLDRTPFDITARLETPANWKATPDDIVTTLPPRGSSTLMFYITPPSYIEPGTYTISAEVLYDGRTLTKDATVIVQPAWAPPLRYILLGLIIILIIAIIAITKMHRERRWDGFRGSRINLLNQIKQEIKSSRRQRRR